MSVPVLKPSQRPGFLCGLAAGRHCSHENEPATQLQLLGVPAVAVAIVVVAVALTLVIVVVVIVVVVA